MRLFETFNEGSLADLQAKQKTRLDTIKQALDSGKVLTLVNASSAPGRVALGDLRELGYAHKERGTEYSGGSFEEYWVVDADIKFKFDGDERIYKKGDQTDPITVKY